MLSQTGLTTPEQFRDIVVKVSGTHQVERGELARVELGAQDERRTPTLLAMVLAIGLVVDDAIVVLENIHRHIEGGMQPVAAAVRGVREIGFAVIAMMLMLAPVYAPIAFATGKTQAGYSWNSH